MLSFINIMVTVIYIISAAWMWNSMEDTEKWQKVIWIVASFFISFLLTKILYNASQSKITYENIELKQNMKLVIVGLFTGINSFIFPIIMKNCMKVKNNEQEPQKFKVKMIVLAILFIIIILFEKGYIVDIQKGTLNIYQTSVEEMKNEKE